MRFSENGGRPGDRRGFLHKSFIGRAVGGVAKKFIASTPIGLAATTAFNIIKPPTRKTLPRTQTARPSIEGQMGKQLGKHLKFGGGNGGGLGGPGNLSFPTTRTRPRPTGLAPPIAIAPSGGRTPCDYPMVRDSEGRCRMPTSGEFGGEQFGVGEAVMGRYGAALQPGSKIIDRAICLRGMQLGDDGLCYNKGNITNKQRMWPAGRKPLLSGGDMRAIGVAARAGRRLEGATKRLQRLGMMKKPARRAPPAHRHAKAATGVVSV